MRQATTPITRHDRQNRSASSRRGPSPDCGPAAWSPRGRMRGSAEGVHRRVATSITTRTSSRRSKSVSVKVDRPQLGGRRTPEGPPVGVHTAWRPPPFRRCSPPCFGANARYDGGASRRYRADCGVRGSVLAQPMTPSAGGVRNGLHLPLGPTGTCRMDLMAADVRCARGFLVGRER